NQQYCARDRLYMGVQKVLEHLTNGFYAPLSYLSYLAAAAVLVLGLWKNRKQFALAFFINGIVVLFWLYLGFRGRIVERVCYGMFLLQLLSMLAVGWEILRGLSQKESGRSGAARWLSGGVAAVCCLLLAWGAGTEWKTVE